MGRVVKGQWVFRGICHEMREFFVTIVDKHDKKTLLPIIYSKIRPGSIIFSDCWKTYSTLNELQYLHQTVNHTYNFVDPTTYAHTQNIKNLWWQIKRTLPSTHSCHDQLYLHLSECMWRNSKNKESDLFIEFFKDAGKYVLSLQGSFLFLYCCAKFTKKKSYFCHFRCTRVLQTFCVEK